VVADPALLSDDDYPADPYPGARPDCSFLHCAGGYAYRLRPGRGGWLVGEQDLDGWLLGCGVAGLADRVPVLAYGSNACPSKITWLRAELGLTGPVVVLRARTVGVSAVWAAARRRRDGQVPAVLAAMPGRVETHAVWLADPAQLAVLDVCEGRGERYDLVRLERLAEDRDEADCVEIRAEDGDVLDRPLAYVTHGAARAPMLCDGRYVPICDVDQAGAQHLLATAAATPGPHHDACGLPVTVL
jgi:hypothetical protein